MADSISQLTSLAQLVVKDRVSVGGLTEEQRPQALVLAWAALPWTPMNEPEVNQALKAALAGAARCLATDHVELRRWLVDAGWLERDGFGRQYRRVPSDRLRDSDRPWALLWADGNVTDWVAEHRERQAVRRAQRRKAWQGIANTA